MAVGGGGCWCMKFGTSLVSVIAGGLGLLIAQPHLSAAQTAVFMCVGDTSLVEHNPDNNLGGMAVLPIGRSDTGPIARGLFKFTVADTLPAGSVIRAATLELEVVNRGLSVAREFSVHRLLRAWGEGNKAGGDGEEVFGAPAEAGEATWNARLFPTTLWSEPGAKAGADYISTASATESLSGVGRYSFISTNLASDVQGWLDNPGTNFGWLVKVRNELQTGTLLSFSSRENVAARLRVQYEPPGQISPELRNVRLIAGALSFEFHAEQDRSYNVEYTTDFAAWLFHNVVPPGPARTVTVAAPVVSENRCYRVVGP